MVVRGILVSLVLSAVAHAQPKANVPPLVGATEVAKLTAAFGFIDDAIAADDQRIVYAISDAGTKSELHVVTLATKQETIADIAAVTTHPIAVRIVGARAFVIGQTEDGNQVAALVELTGTKAKPAGSIVYKIGPATHITIVTRDGKPRAA